MAIGDQADDQTTGAEFGQLKAALVVRDGRIAGLTELVVKQSAQIEKLIELLGKIHEISPQCSHRRPC